MDEANGTLDWSDRSVAEWLALWSGTDVAPGTPEEIVGPLLTYNRWRPSPEWDGDVRVMVVEQQGVWLWGHSPHLGFVERANEPGTDWRPTAESESQFWLHHAAFEFVSSRFAAYRSTNDAPSAVSDLVVEASHPLPCREWTWPGRQHMHFRGNSVAMISENSGHSFIQVGAPSESSLHWADELGIDWNESDSRSE
ncbi:MAG TPA: hypothetical protein GXZ60_03895 [Intrasporangiaceae bacterium]|nr:hypothetical protein [Intrasporangiaceae bacterium]